jgi:hypothetical protein
MTNVLFLILTFIALSFSSCKQNFIEAIQPKPSKDIKQAKKRLISVPKWTIDEASENGLVIYQNGVNSSNDNDIDIDYVKFREDGVFEVAYKNEPLELLSWSLDEVKNILTIFDKTELDYREDWQIEAGSVYENAFTMSYTYEEKYQTANGPKTETIKYTLKMKRKE